MKVLLIYNPFSGNGSFKNNLDYILEQFNKNNMDLVIYRLNDNETIQERIACLNTKEYSKILIAGGDGTINQVVNAMMKCDVNLPIGIYPVGTANDYASYFNLPKNIPKLTQILLGDNFTYSDIGLANDKYFINVASLGFLVDISQKTDKKLKDNMGVFAYYLKGIEEFPNIRPFDVTITSDSLNITESIYFMLVMNGSSAGGFKKLSLGSSINDGLFNVFLFKEAPFKDLMFLLFKILNGSHVDSPTITYFQTSDLLIESDAHVGTDLDGEIGSDFPISLTNITRKLKIITANNDERHHPKGKNITEKDMEKYIEKREIS